MIWTDCPALTCHYRSVSTNVVSERENFAVYVGMRVLTLVPLWSLCRRIRRQLCSHARGSAGNETVVVFDLMLQS